MSLHSSSQPSWSLQQRADQSQILFVAADSFAENTMQHNGIVVITDGWQEGSIASVLRGGINAQATLEILSRSGVNALKMYHLEEKITALEEVFLSSVVMPAQSLFDSVDVAWRGDPSLFELIKTIGKDYSMLFLGAPLAASEIMPLYHKIKEVYSGSVTIVRGPVTEMTLDDSDEINSWVRERTFDASDFSLPAILRTYKQKLGKKIAVLLPSLNEEKTVGNVIKTALEVKKAGLIDEVILIDSASTDTTVSIAKSFGIPVHLHPEIRPDLGTYRGKGEAMFKSLFVTDAEIIAWVDTDIESIAPRFFYGLLGPLLTDSSLKFSKGYFSRPIRIESSGIELGGGRVTEILARPWLNAFNPELSGYIQPLAGTVAIHRDLLVKMRIPVNYGVEAAMLLQAVRDAGLWATCQVNLGEVLHRSKDVAGLSEMSFQIIQVLASMFANNPDIPVNDLLRRVHSAHGSFMISSKRFRTVWRNFPSETGF